MSPAPDKRIQLAIVSWQRLLQMLEIAPASVCLEEGISKCLDRDKFVGLALPAPVLLRHKLHQGIETCSLAIRATIDPVPDQALAVHLVVLQVYKSPERFVETSAGEQKAGWQPPFAIQANHIVEFSSSNVCSYIGLLARPSKVLLKELWSQATLRIFMAIMPCHQNVLSFSMLVKMQRGGLGVISKG